MKKIYFLVCFLAFALAGNGQVLLINENFDDWNPTGTPGFTVNTYGNWDFTSPRGIAFQFRNCRVPSVTSANRMVDIHANDQPLPGGTVPTPGQLIFTVPSCSRIDILIRSASNTPVAEPDRFMYIAREIFGAFQQVSADFPAIPVDTIWHSDAVNVVTESQATFAIMTKRRAAGIGGAGRLEGLRVWSHATPTGIDGTREANIVIYSTPRNIRIGGDVVSVEVINLAGVVVARSTQRGIQSIPVDGLAPGIYMVKAVDGSGLVKVEKVIVR